MGRALGSWSLGRPVDRLRALFGLLSQDGRSLSGCSRPIEMSVVPALEIENKLAGIDLNGTWGLRAHSSYKGGPLSRETRSRGRYRMERRYWLMEASGSWLLAGLLIESGLCVCRAFLSQDIRALSVLCRGLAWIALSR